MSSLPDFDVYVELELTSTATPAEVSAAYKRMALLHHPDKNSNSPESTAKFQRIQAAYSVLNNAATRNEYDTSYPARRQYTNSSTSTRYTSERGSYHPSYWGDDYSHFFHRSSSSYEYEDDFYPFGRPPSPGGFFFGTSFYSFASSHSQSYEEDRGEARQKAHQEAVEKERVRQAQAEREEARRKEAEELSKQTRLREEKEKLERLGSKRVEQERIWAENNATTIEEKRKWCEHADFWPKVRSVKKGEKLRCDSCSKKRGMHGFECPNCRMIACQVCLTKFANERKEKLRNRD